MNYDFDPVLIYFLNLRKNNIIIMRA